MMEENYKINFNKLYFCSKPMKSLDKKERNINGK